MLEPLSLAHSGKLLYLTENLDLTSRFLLLVGAAWLVVDGIRCLHNMCPQVVAGICLKVNAGADAGGGKQTKNQCASKGKRPHSLDAHHGQTLSGLCSVV